MQHVSNSIAIILVKGRIAWALLALMVTGVLGFYAATITFDMSPEAIFIEDDEAYLFYKERYLSAFSHVGNPCIVAIEAKDPTQDLTKFVKIIAEKLAKNPHITQIISPLNQPIFLPTEEGIKPFSAVDESGKLTEIAKGYFREHPLYQGSLIGKDSRSMALLFVPDLKFQDMELQEKVIESIQHDIAMLEQAMPELAFYVTGLPFIQHEMVSLLKRDQMIFVPLLVLFLAVLLMIMTKHYLGALFPLLIISLALVWTLGYMAFIGHEINVVNNTIFILIMVIGIADAVHIYTRFVDEGSRSKTMYKEAMVTKTMAAMLVPCLLTSLTTALGFVASSAAGVSIIKEFGYDAAVGVLFCFVITMMVMPTLLLLHPTPTGHQGGWFSRWPHYLRIDTVLRWSLGKSLRFAKPLTVMAIVLMVISIYGARTITANQTWVGELPKDNQSSVALRFVENNFSGVMPFYVVFSGEQERLRSYAVAQQIHVLAEKLRAHGIKPTIRSPIDAINFVLEHNPAPLQLNAIDEDTYQELSMGMQKFIDDSGDGAMDTFWSQDHSSVRILGFLANADTGQIERFRDDVETMIKAQPSEGVSTYITGPAFISSRALHNLTHDMARSIGLAVLYITIFMALFFRSIRYSIIAMVPNLLPIALTIAFMNIAGIDVRLATVMIFSMALGLSIDTCIHLLCRVLEETAKVSDNYKKLSFIRSLFHAFHGSGRPIIYTTIILLGGFFVMMFSRFLALRDFALISAVVLLSALISDIVLLPALIYVMRPREKP